MTKDWAIKAATEATGLQHLLSVPLSKPVSNRTFPEARPPDGRTGRSILICASKKKLKEQVVERLAECVLTAPTTAVFNGITDAEEKIPVKLHFFGDGYEDQKEVGGRKCWAIPIMNGEYVGEEEFGIVKGVAGGNFFIMGENQMELYRKLSQRPVAQLPKSGKLSAASAGIVASGSKVGSLKTSS